MAMNFANAQYNTSDHVNVARHVRKAQTGIVANPTVQNVRQFIEAPLPTFTTPAAFNPGHLLPQQDLTGSPQPMTSTARSAIWSTFAANLSHWYAGYTSKPRTSVPAPIQNTPATTLNL
jgi:hypothetical protein